MPKDITIYGGIKIGSREFLDAEIIRVFHMPIISTMRDWRFAGDQGPEESSIVVESEGASTSHGCLSSAMLAMAKHMPTEAHLVGAITLGEEQWILLPEGETARWYQVSSAVQGVENGTKRAVMLLGLRRNGVTESILSLDLSEEVIALPKGFRE